MSNATTGIGRCRLMGRLGSGTAVVESVPTLSGTAAELRDSDTVRESYFGS